MDMGTSHRYHLWYLGPLWARGVGDNRGAVSLAESVASNNGHFHNGHDPRRGPGGAKPGAGAKPKEVTELRRELFSPETIRTAFAKLMDAVERGDSWAIELTLAYGLGKPKQGVELSGQVEFGEIV